MLGGMATTDIIAALDSEIARLQRARDLLAGTDQVRAASPERPKRAEVKTSAKQVEASPKKRTMSAEGKARIAAAQRDRWAKQHKTTAAAEKATAKKSAGKTAAGKQAGLRKVAGKNASVSSKQSAKSKPAKKASPSKGTRSGTPEQGAAGS